MAKRRKKKVFKIKNIIVLLVILLLLVGMFYYAFTMPIKNIYISGNIMVNDSEILSLSGLDKYPSFLLTTKSKIKNSILNNKYIEDVLVRKKFKGIIELEIAEYRVIAKNIDNKVVVSSGDVLENNYNVSDIPRLVSNLDDDLIKEFGEKFNKISDNILRDISEIEYSPILVDTDRFVLYMNDGNLVYVTLTKVDKMNKYNDIKDELMGKKGIIYLDSGDYVELKS